MALEELKARVEAARAGGGRVLAEALVDLAEAEPALPHRTRPAHALLEEAAALLDRASEPALQGRVLLRLARLKTAEGDFEGGEQLISRAFDLLTQAGAESALIEAGGLLCRIQIRRHQFEAAEGLLVQLIARVTEDPADRAARRAVAELALARAEAALERPGHEGEADLAFRQVLEAARAEPSLGEAEFFAHQALAFAALGRGDPGRAASELRRVVELAKQLGSPEDECEARVALAGVLVERGDLAGREEAERHLQIARDRAIEEGLDGMHMAALVGQAALMARRGQTQGALDRCLEVARSAVERKDVPRYVAAAAMMASIYERNGDFASAYRALAEANAGLKEKLGPEVQALVRPHVQALAERMGRERFLEMVDSVQRASLAREDFRPE